MSTSCRLLSLVALSAFALTAGGVARAQQSSAQQKCVTGLNKDTAKVGAAQGKENAACVKLAVKGTANAACLTADPKSKVASAKAKTTADESGNLCLTTNAPPFGYGGGVAGNAAAIAEELGLFDDTYGTTDPTVVISTAKADGNCQSAVTKDLEKIIATQWKEYLGCKKTALKGGATSVSALENCVTPGGIDLDAKGKIAKTRSKLDADITKKCTGVTPATAFPGTCSGAALGTLGECLEARAACRVCRAVNAIDEMNVNCDLLDDGATNGSCEIGEHTCTLAAGSQLRLYSSVYAVPLNYPLVGVVGIGAAGTEAICDIQTVDPINVVGIGFACITAADGCAPGARFCGPGAPGSGPALGVSVTSNGNAGACTSNGGCAATCAGVCGGAARVLGSGCTGFCSAGDQSACTTDNQCKTPPKGGVCNGPNPVGTHGGVCQCTCVDRAAFGGSDAGDFQCTLGVNLVFETALPCNGTDVTINAGSACVPVSSQRASGVVTNANFNPVSCGPGASGPPCTLPPGGANNQTGTPLACATVDGGTLTGLTGVGAGTFFGSALLNDLSVGVKTLCQ